MELDDILLRLQKVTNKYSNHGMTKALGLGATSAGNWKSRNTIPYHACFLAAQNFGYNMEWILTGEGPEKKGEAPPTPLPEFDKDKMVNDFQDIIVDGIELGFLKTTIETTEANLGILGNKFYRKLTGETLQLSGEAKKKAV